MKEASLAHAIPNGMAPARCLGSRPKMAVNERMSAHRLFPPWLIFFLVP